MKKPILFAFLILTHISVAFCSLKGNDFPEKTSSNLSLPLETKPKTNYQHTLRVGLSFTPGIMPQNSLGNTYLSGALEYYLSTHFSLASTVMVFLNNNLTKDEESVIMGQGGQGVILKMNHQNYTGLRYHFLKDKSFDPFIGFQPGFAITQTNENYYDDEILTYGFVYNPPRHDTKVSLNPMASFDVGFNFYAVKYFHLFVNSRYVMGLHLGGLKPYRLNELQVSFGLGLNLNIWNIKKK